MRWTKRTWIAALLLAALAGCKQQCFLKEGDWDHTRDQLAGTLANLPHATDPGVASVVHSGTPATVLDPDRPPRYMCLAEAIARALEHGTVGQGTTGQPIDFIEVGQSAIGIGASELQSDQIRVLALDPARNAAIMEASLSKFDALFQTSMAWNTTDRPIGTALDAFQAGRSGALNAIQTDSASFASTLAKPLPTGGIAGITFSTDYQFTNLPAAVNPSYTPRLQFLFEQPLLQGFGVEINQLRAAHPGPSGFLQGLPNTLFRQPTSEGILLSRIRYDLSRARFETAVAQMLVNCEQAYWNLYGAYWNLYSREQGLRLAYESWRVTRVQYLAGGAKKKTLADVARTRGQYELFRGQRIQALGLVLERERFLRRLLGMCGEDCTRIVPCDVPTLSQYSPDWCSAIDEAIRLRPELAIAREHVQIAQLSLIEQKNFLLPDLRTFASYDINSIGSRLDGPTNTNAFRNLSDNTFNSWTLGLLLRMPLGLREAHANVRRSRLELARTYTAMKQLECTVESNLQREYRRLFELYEQIKAQRAQREAYGLQLKLRFLLVGEQTDLSDQTILEAQRFFAEALANEYQAIVDYNNTLALFEYNKGTLLTHNNVVIGEGPLPEFVKERAADHYEKRQKALLLKTRPEPLTCTESKDDEKCVANREVLVPKLPENKAGGLYGRFEGMTKLPDDRGLNDLPLPAGTAVDLTTKPVPPQSNTSNPADWAAPKPAGR